MKFLEDNKKMLLNFGILILLDFITTFILISREGIEGELNPLLTFLYNHLALYSFIPFILIQTLIVVFLFWVKD